MKILEIEFIEKTENFAWTKIKYRNFLGKEKESYIITAYVGKVDVGSKLWPSGERLPYSLEKIVVSFIERALKNKI